MATKEQQIIDFGRANGKSQSEINNALKKLSRSKESDIVGDIRGIGEGIARSAETRGTKLAEDTQTGNILQKGLRAFGQGAGFASDVVGETILGAGKAVLPEAAERAVGQTFKAGAEAVGSLDPVQSLMKRYELLQTANPELAKDVDAFLGIGQLALDVGTAGIGGRAVQVAGKGAELAGKGVAKGTGLVTKGAGRVVGEIEGTLTGTSQETLEQAFNAAYRGGDELQNFTKALRNELTPEQLVVSLREGIDQIDNAKSVSYSNTIQKIGGVEVAANGVKPAFVNKLSDFGIAVDKTGALDFSKSKFRTVPAAQTKLQTAYNEIAAISAKESILSIDTTRQALRELLFAGDDPSARAANAIITDGITSVKRAGETIPEYKIELAKFAEDAEFLGELKKSLATGDKASVDTTYRRLATSLKTNNERRMNLVRELDEITDGFVLSSVSGQQLSELLPRGIFKQIGGAIAAGGILTGTLPISAIISTLVFASPRVVGEVIRALGIGSRKAQIIIDAINAARRTLDLSGIKLPVVGAVKEGTEEDK